MGTFLFCILGSNGDVSVLYEVKNAIPEELLKLLPTEEEINLYMNEMLNDIDNQEDEIE